MENNVTKNNKINWKQKLSSRKFWASISGAVVSFLSAFNFSDNTIAQVAGIISGVGILCYYIFSETKIDKARIDSEVFSNVEIEQQAEEEQF